MARYGLDLQQKNKSKKKRTVTFICVFMCFVILLGSVSVLLLWRSLNYDFNNIFVVGDVSTTKEPETTKPEEKVYAGEHLFLVAVTSDDGKETRFLNLISVDLEGGRGYYISKGEIVAINWSRETETSPILFTDTDGNELEVNPGKSYIGFAPKNKLTYK